MNYGEISTDNEIQAYLDDAYDRWRDDQMEKKMCTTHNKEKAVYASAKTEKAEYFCTDCFTEEGE